MRRLARRPLLTLVATATLALGIGGATAVFSVAQVVILRPLPYAQPDRLVLVWQSDLQRGQPFVEMSYPTFRDWRARNTVFDDLAGLPSTNQSWILHGRGEPVQLVGRLVSWNFFSVLGLPAALQRVVRELDPERPAPEVVAMTSVVSAALGAPRFAARVFSAFALVALLLAGLGLYGLVAYSVGRRTREIGVRVALGARPTDVARLVLGEGLGLALLGLALGLAASLGGARLLSSLLFEIGPTDALTLAAASVLLIAIAVLASALPARCALRVQPAVALRQE